MAAPKVTNTNKGSEEGGLSDSVKAELETLTATERAAVIMLLLGEQQAADCIRYLSPREVQSLGACMVSVVDLSQEAVNVVLDIFWPRSKNRPVWVWVRSTMLKTFSRRPWAKTRRRRFWVESCLARPAKAWRFYAGWMPDRLARWCKPSTHKWSQLFFPFLNTMWLPTC